MVVPGFMAPFARRVQGMARKLQGLANPQTDNTGVLNLQNLNDQLKVSLGPGWQVGNFSIGGINMNLIYQAVPDGQVLSVVQGYIIATGNLQIQQTGVNTISVTWGLVTLIDNEPLNYTNPGIYSANNVPTIGGTPLSLTPPLPNITISAATTYIYLHVHSASGACTFTIENGASVPVDVTGVPADYYYALGYVTFASGAITDIIWNKYTSNNIQCYFDGRPLVPFVVQWLALA